jgi:hypothetical protein
MLVITAVGGLGIGVVAAGPAADASQTHAAPRVTVTPVAPAAVTTPTLNIKSEDPSAHLANGDIFAGVKYDLGAPPSGSAIGPDIVDDHGRQIYFAQSPTSPAPGSTGAQRATDVKAQMYRGQRVLTFWQGGTGFGNPGIGAGSDYIYNQHYKLIRTVHAHNSEGGQPLQADQHEFLLTPGGTAIIVAYGETTTNANPYRPSGDTVNRRHQAVFDCVIQEINLDTSKVVFEWHSLNHISPARSHQPLPGDSGTPGNASTGWDYFHINSVKIDSDFNLIVSGRHTWAFYKINRHTGATMWQVQTGLTNSGKYTTGAQSTFKIGSGAAFAWQHDPEPLGNNEYRIFDNNSNQAFPPPFQPAHVLTLKLNMANHTATNVQHINYSGGSMIAGSQGNSQQLSASHILIGWGAGGDITEVNAQRQQIFDAAFQGNGFNTYRAYKSEWVGTPSAPPTISMHTVNGKKQVDAVWNGANTVANWRILGGSNTKNMSTLVTTRWNGLDTAFRLSSYPAYVKAVALSASGKVLARTAATHT